MSERLFAVPEEGHKNWELEVVDHAKQTDSSNCGVYCLLVWMNILLLKTGKRSLLTKDVNLLKSVNLMPKKNSVFNI